MTSDYVEGYCEGLGNRNRVTDLTTQYISGGTKPISRVNNVSMKVTSQKNKSLAEKDIG